MKAKVIFILRLCIAGLLLSVFVSGYSKAREALWIEGEDYTSSSWNNHSWYSGTNISKDLLSPGKPGESNGDQETKKRVGETNEYFLPLYAQKGPGKGKEEHAIETGSGDK